MLGPGVNLARVPWCGRLYEYLGEDPVLAGALVAAIIRGVQSNNVSACVKHYLANSQEFSRNNMDALISDRALHELYYPAYERAIDAGVGSFMVAVNAINHEENSASTATLSHIFETAGFQGFCMTDWAGINLPNASAAAWAGTSVEMPRGYQYQYLPQFIANGSVPLTVIDTLVTRVLTAAAGVGLLDTPAQPAQRNVNSIVSSDAHTRLARRVAEESAVLLKNDVIGGSPVLPIDPHTVKSILVLGDETTVVGCGSGQVQLPYVVTPQEGIYRFFNGNASRPVNCTLFPDVDFFQDGARCVTVSDIAACCELCTHTDGCNAWTLVPNANCPGQPMPQPSGQCFLKPDTRGRTAHPGLTSGTCAPLPPGPVPITYNVGNDSAIVASLAAQADLVVAVVTPGQGCEGADRTNLSLPDWQNSMVAAAAAANARTVVVTRCAGACLMPWIGAVPAVVQHAFAGQEAGTAIANVLFGVVNPSGKLALSFPVKETDTWIQQQPQQYPGVLQDGFYQVEYSEELLVGYRWFDAKSIQPLFPFGFGLSYSTFAFDTLNVTGVVSSTSVTTIEFNVCNTAGPSGAEVAQLYISHPAAAGEPPRVLRDFTKVALGPDACEHVMFTLSVDDVRIWTGSWTVVPGQYGVHIGPSSSDLPLSGSFSVVA
eukprot:m.112178 g.112178  ORF g.112178 m.112178 type:complete len:658 (+) comp9107_c0_seq2:268-2241(+)